MAGELILIANDEPDIRRIMVDRLRYRGFEVQAVGDGLACIEAVEGATPDLVLLDVRMPRMDGLLVLDWLEAHYPEVPVLMVSASADRQVVEASLARGVVDYVIKPYEARTLEDKVMRAMDRDGRV